jgi:hypothetical protein
VFEGGHLAASGGVNNMSYSVHGDSQPDIPIPISAYPRQVAIYTPSEEESGVKGEMGDRYNKNTVTLMKS